MVKLLPLYTERQKDIIKEMQQYHSWALNRVLLELEFQIEPIIKNIVEEMLKDKTLTKALKILKKGLRKSKKRREK